MSTLLPAVIPPRYTLSMLMAFDVGESFVFKIHHRASKSDILAFWEKHFPKAHGWNCRQYPASFNKPLGWKTALDLTRETCPALRETFDKLEAVLKTYDLSARCESAQAVFFPVGIAVMVVRLSLGTCPFTPTERWQELWNGGRTLYSKLIAEAASRYLKCMTAALGNTPGSTIKPLPHLTRNRIHRAGSVYFLFFVDGKSFNAQLPRTVRNERKRLGTYGEARVCVDWGEGLVHAQDDAHQEAVERLFVIATASWYALQTSERLLSKFGVDELFGMDGSQHGHLRQTQLLSLRIFYTDLLSAWNPNRWTANERDLELLHLIHTRWNSEKSWRNVKARTNFLALLQAAAADYETDRNNRRALELAIGGVAIGAFTLASAIVDVAGLINAKRWVAMGFAIGIPLALVLAVVLYFWARDHHPPAAKLHG